MRLHLATPQAGTRADPQDWADEIDAAITSLTAVFGPFPYPELWVAITPGQSEDTEFPRRCSRRRQASRSDAQHP